MNQFIRFTDPARKLLQGISASLFLLSLAACGGGSSTSAPAVPGVNAASAAPGNAPPATPGVNAAPVAPGITAAPQSQSASVGNAVQFSVQATGTAPISYQWQRDGVDIPGATAASYTLGAASLADSNAHYRVLLKNGAGSTTSAEATLKVSGIELFAGSLTETGYVDGAARDARFRGVAGLAFDAAGNLVVTDRFNQALRKIGKDGTVSTIAGQAQGLFSPIGVMLDASGNAIVSDGDIRKVTPAGVVSLAFTIPVGASDSRSSVMFTPTGVAIDANGNMYAANGVGTRKVTPAGGLSIIEGVDVVNGVFGTRGVSYRGMARDSSGNVYFGNADSIAKAGIDGSIKPYLANTAGAWLTIDTSGNLYRTTIYGDVITRIDASGKETTVAGVAGATGDPVTITGALPGRLNSAQGMAFDSKGFLYVSNAGTAILKIGLP